MEYLTLLALVFVVSVVVMVAVLFVVLRKGGKKGNIMYLIIQSYLGIKKPLIRRGLVTLDDAEHVAIFKMFDVGGVKEIGIFHQKYLMPLEKGYLMLLDQFEVERYRPMEITDDVKEDLLTLPETDFLGLPALDEKGEQKKTVTNTGKRAIKPTSNNDIDFIIGLRAKIKEKLLKREKKSSLWKTLAAIAIYFFLFLSIAFNAYYNYESHKENIGMIERQSEAKIAEEVTRTIMYVLMNQTVKDVVKQKTAPPPNG